MKAVILAAGLGKRLRPLTYDTPKPMIDIAGKPLLEWILLGLKKHGVNEATIVVGYHKDKIINYFGDGRKLGMQLDYVTQQNPEGGTADAVKTAEKNVTENFFVVAGDELKDFSVIDEMRKNECDGMITAYRVKNPEQYGVLEVNGNNVLRIREKDVNPVSNFINISLYRFSIEIFDAIKKIKPSPRGELEITDAINLLIDEGFVFHYVESKYYFDMSSMDGLEKAREFFKKLS